MKIWFWTWVYFKIFENDTDRVSQKFLDIYKTNITNSIEITCVNEEALDVLINNGPETSMYEFVSIHAPWIDYNDNDETIRVLDKMQEVTNRYNLKNIVIHPDRVNNWNIFNNYKDLSISIENMDIDKKYWQTVEDIKKY